MRRFAASAALAAVLVLGIQAQAVNEIEAVHAGHQDVGHDHGRTLALDHFQGLLPVPGGDDAVAFKFQCCFE